MSATVTSVMSCPTLFYPMDCSPAGSSIHGTLQAKILEWVVIPFSKGSSQPRGQTQVSFAAKLLQSYPTLCNPIDGSPSGSSVPGILQARILEWVAISFSNACSPAKSLQSCPTLCDPTDSSPPGSSVHGTPQARILKSVVISFSNIPLYYTSN